MLLAFLAIFLPVEWMAATHRWLGLGHFPAVPIVDYLTRSLSALYAIHGGLLLVVSGNVRRYSVVVAYLAVVSILFGVAMVVIDLRAGMPLFWTLGEGPPLFAFGLLLLYLLRFVPRE